jgi:hypothetical protein
VTIQQGPVAGAPAAPGLPQLRWSSRARSVEAVAAELGKIWASISLTATGQDGEPERRVAARSSVMNLVVIAQRGEIGERAASIERPGGPPPTAPSWSCRPIPRPPADASQGTLRAAIPTARPERAELVY